ncbi:MAG: UDP-N-acetylglucosamine 2-epimerase (non-hydrolyzing) [Acidihalobacter sp.]|uniref:non-hydrolyzing UDP-N-acetylglucosamine 2-epimerase n=1 Tax=Acidihalobacter sp. TaxID=1872108 RepID=UPI00307EFEEA
MPPLKVDLVVAARPNYMKVGPLYRVLRDTAWCEPRLVDAGQHYDRNLSEVFRQAFDLPPPEIALVVGSASHGEQTARVMSAYERVCLNMPPDWIVVVGDVNATMAAALVGAKLHIPVAHLEAGLRSRDRTMPEEINRIVTDAVSDLLWTPSTDATENLLAENVPASRIDFVGNVMIDAYRLLKDRIDADGTRRRLGLHAGEYAVATLHRPSNVDEPQRLAALVDALNELSRRMRLVFPLHPRTFQQLQDRELLPLLQANPDVLLTEPLAYIPFMNVLQDAALVVTDSGGLQEETTYLGIPCLTLRENTERPITVSAGTNRLISIAELPSAVDAVLRTGRRVVIPPALWDGHAANRIASSLKEHASR